MMDNHYLDYISTLNKREWGDGEGIKDLFVEHFDIIRPILRNIYWVDASMAYMNYTCGVPQTEIAKLFGVSQLAVSRRVRACVRKMSIQLNRPEANSDIVKRDLSVIFDDSFIEPLTLYYFVPSFSFIHRITGKIFHRNKVLIAKKYMDKLQKYNNPKEFLKYVVYNKEKIKEMIDKGQFPYVYGIVIRYNNYFSMLFATNTYSFYQFKVFDDKRKKNAKI